MKVALYETEEWERSACAVLQTTHELVCTSSVLDLETAVQHQDAEIVSTFVNSRLGGDVLALFPYLRLIATRSTGWDHIDIDYCAAHGITVCNVPNYGDATVAEHAFALLLALSRHIVAGVQSTRQGHFRTAGLRGFDLRSRTLGVVGTGRIGRRAIEIAKGFGMQVVATDIAPDQQAAAEWGFRYTSLKELLALSDVVTLHVPATAETAALISDRELELMKPGAFLINTARGSIVDVGALVRALASGHLGGAGLDVLPWEPLIRDEAEIFRSEETSDPTQLLELVANHALLQMPNVLITPHNAYNTEEALARIAETTIQNIVAFIAGTPQNVVLA